MSKKAGTILTKSQLTANVAGKYDSREVLHGICINKDEAITTNGKVLLIIKHDKDRQEKFTRALGADILENNIVLPLTLAKDVASVMILNSHPFAVSEHGVYFSENQNKINTIGKDLKNISFEKSEIEGTYPDYKKCIPGGEPNFEICFDVSLLKNLLTQIEKVLKERCNCDARTVTLKVIDSQTVVWFENEQAGVYGYIMPMRNR